jgi:hypothetical protein
MRGHNIPEWCVVRTGYDVTFSATKLIVQSAIYPTGTLYLNTCLSVMDKFDPDLSRMRGQNLCEKEASNFPYSRFPIAQYDECHKIIKIDFKNFSMETCLIVVWGEWAHNFIDFPSLYFMFVNCLNKFLFFKTFYPCFWNKKRREIALVYRKWMLFG